jgi:Uma2 family endonuclease
MSRRYTIPGIMPVTRSTKAEFSSSARHLELAINGLLLAAPSTRPGRHHCRSPRRGTRSSQPGDAGRQTASTRCRGCRRAIDENTTRIPSDAVTAVVEIVSPSTVSIDRAVKPAMYAEAGIPVYWRVELHDTAKIVVCTLRQRTYITHATVAAGARPHDA